MPERKGVFRHSWSQAAFHAPKKDPGKTGVFFFKKALKSKPLDPSETEIWQVAVAVRDAGVGHQDVVDHRQQAAEPGGGGG